MDSYKKTKIEPLELGRNTIVVGEEKGKRNEGPGYSAAKDDSKQSASDTAVLPASALIGSALTGAAISKPSETGYISWQDRIWSWDLVSFVTRDSKIPRDSARR